MAFQVSNCSNGSADKHVGLPLCLLVSTLYWHGFHQLIHLSRFLDMRAAPSEERQMMSCLIRPGLLQKVCHLSPNSTLFAGYHLNSQQQNNDMQLNMSSLARFGKGPEKILEFDITFAYVHTTLILVTSKWHNWVSLALT